MRDRNNACVAESADAQDLKAVVLQNEGKKNN